MMPKTPLEKKPKHWFRRRNYLHLTNKIEEIPKKVYSSYLVATHAFFPLLYYCKKQRRYKAVEITDEKGHKKFVRRHSYLKNGKIKKTVKERPIHFATHIDAHIYAYYARKLSKRYEKHLKDELHDCVTAYRRIWAKDGKRHKSNIDFAYDVFQEIRKREECYVLTFDIKSFFSSLNHKRLKQSWYNLLGLKTLPKDHYNIFKSITRFSYINLDDLRLYKGGGFDEKQIAQNKKDGVHAFFNSNEEFREAIKAGKVRIRKNQFTKKRKNKKTELIGIPQGLPISSVLANIYLLEFDKFIVNEFVRKENAYYRRYSDDIVIICSKNNYQNIIRSVTNKIAEKEFDLKIEASKTEVFRVEKTVEGKLIVDKETKIGFQKKPIIYLGFEFNGDKILLKSASLGKFYRNMKRAINTKKRRIEQVKKKTKDENVILFQRKLYKKYTYLGKKKRKYKNPSDKNDKRKYRGNFITYAEKASDIMDEKAIKRQLRNHFKIFKNYMKAKGLKT